MRETLLLKVTLVPVRDTYLDCTTQKILLPSLMSSTKQQALGTLVEVGSRWHSLATARGGEGPAGIVDVQPTQAISANRRIHHWVCTYILGNGDTVLL